MTGRLERTRRLLAVQRKRNQLSEWRLRELLSLSATLDERYRNLVRFVQAESAFSVMFSLSVTRRLQRLTEMRVKATSDQEAGRKVHFHDRRCLHRMERIVQMLDADETRKDAARELGEMIDSAAQRLSQGSCKLPDLPFPTPNLAGDDHGVDKPGFGYCA